jgi:hypothetical protein
MGAVAQKESIYIQTRPRHTRDVPRPVGDQQTEKQHSHIDLYITSPRSCDTATIAFLPSHRHHPHKHFKYTHLILTCLDAEKVERCVYLSFYRLAWFSQFLLGYRDSERVELNATARFFVTTFKVNDSM